MRGRKSGQRAKQEKVRKSAFTLVFAVSALLGQTTALLLPALAANPAPPVAPSRLTRPGSAGSTSQSNTLTGSVTQTTLNSSRLTRTTPAGSTTGLNPASATTIPQAAPSASSASLFSQTDKDAFSAFSAPLPPPTTPTRTPSNYGAVNSNGISGGVTQTTTQSTVTQSTTTNRSGSSDLLKKGAGLYSQIQQDFAQSPMLRAGASSLIRGLVGGRGPLTGSASSTLAGSAANAINRSVSRLPYIGRTLNKQELSLLSNYEVAVIIDKSGSMDEPDCPGNLTRWDWCASQLSNLASQTASVFRSGITVALFSSDYQVYRNADFSTVSNIFSRNSPSGGTYMAKPMSEVLDEYFDRRDHSPSSVRKLLIEVISDGEPSDRGELIATIARATQKMTRPDEVRINFIQIGNERSGAQLLNRLDNRLAPDEGAQYDIVSVSPFFNVATEGLPGAMADAARH